MSGFTKQEQEDFDRAMDSMYEHEQGIVNHNSQFLADNGIPYEDFESLINDCTVTDKISFVEKPLGTDNHEDEHGVFKRVFVRQWSVGMEGDSFEGIIYGEITHDKWLAVPYSC